jgi:hypothetical protein
MRSASLTGLLPMAVVVIVLVLSFALSPRPAVASDRDTPAYLIYVDPVTGKYTTKRPDTNAQAVNGPTAGSLESSAVTGNAIQPGAGGTATPAVNSSRTMRAPFTAILLLVGLGLISLLFRKQST